MPGKLELIAERIRDLREIAGISLKTAASAVGLDEASYAQYESGSVDIPIGVLFEVAGFYSVDLTEILTGESPRLTKYSVVRRGKGIEVERRAPYKYHSLAFNFVHKKAEPFLVEAGPAPEGARMPLNSHPGQEFDFVIEGRLMVSIDGHEIVLDEGDSVFFDSGAQHGMKALGGAPARFLAIIL
jgi:quercetin dioxygenase-like cupin family protein/DNA-binding XRE family transcriptional regulator